MKIEGNISCWHLTELPYIVAKKVHARDANSLQLAHCRLLDLAGVEVAEEKIDTALRVLLAGKSDGFSPSTCSP